MDLLAAGYVIGLQMGFKGFNDFGASFLGKILIKLNVR